MNLYNHQKKIITLEPKRTGLFLGTGCLHPDTIIYDPIQKTKKTVKQRAEEKKEFYVWSKNKKGKLVITKAEVPVEYTKASFLKFSFSNASSISVTPEHRFWINNSYVTAFEIYKNFVKHTSCSSFSRSHNNTAAIFSFHVLSSSALSPLGSPLSALRYWQTIASFLSYYFVRCRQCDQQPLGEIKNGPSSFPLQDDVHEPYFDDFYKDDLEHISKHIRVYHKLFHFSKIYFFSLVNNKNVNVFLSSIYSNGKKLFLFQVIISFLSRSYSCLFRIIFLFFHSSIYLNKKIEIMEVEWEQSIVPYYDFHVPYYQNYYASGIIHHNSGKSLTASLLAQGRTLVICPKTQAQDDTWTKAWSMAGKNPALLTVISKEQFKKNHTTLSAYDTVIIDEAHTVAGVSSSTYQRNYIKYPKTSQIYRAVKDYIDTNPPKRLYLLTATPISTPMTLYGIASILGYQWSYTEFRDTFYWQWKRNIWRVKNTKECKEKLAFWVNKIGHVGRLQDWFDVPDQTYRTEHVGTTAEQRKTFQDLRLVYPDPLVQLGKRHQLEQGIYEGEWIKENKIKAIEQYAREFKKIIVFCRYTAQIEYYADKLKAYTLTGKTKNRGALFAALQKKDSYILIAQSSISTGWELPDCPCMIFASESYKAVDREQGEGRVLRVNKLKKNIYITLLSGEADKKIHGVILEKKDFTEYMHSESLASNNIL